jgi:class 3 adenylate cyclase/CHAT domain-containing protein
MEEKKTDVEQLLAERAEIERILKTEFSKDVTIMFTDIKGSTSFYETRGDLDGRAMVHRHNAIVLPCIEANQGRLVKTIGDATMSIYEEPEQGVMAAMEIQKKLLAHNKGKQDHEQIHVRIGVNYGTGIVEEKDVFGDVVNVASRAESLADADEILVTESLYRKVKSHDEFIFRYHDSAMVKGKKEPLKVYRLVWHEEDLCMGKTRKQPAYVRRKANVFVLDVSLSGDALKVSGFARTEGEERAVKEYAERAYNSNQVKTYTEGIIDLLNRANRRGKIGNDLLVKLKEYGSLLYDELIPLQVKERIAKTEEKNLMLAIDDNLVHIPWELLYDGKDFFCQRFSIGRIVSTRQAVSVAARAISRPLKMQILADPRGDLSASYEEGVAIKDEMVKLEDWVDVTLKTTSITMDYVKAKIRNFDIVHYAGHGEHDAVNPAESGWIMGDGKLSAREIMNMAGAMPMPSLIFSNACQTGQTDEWRIGADYERKIFGLANAFLLSGVQHYIGTFWEIPDEAGRHFAAQFYRSLIEGTTVGEALRLAKLSLIDKYGEDTIVWASYMLYGDPTTQYIFPEMAAQEEAEAAAPEGQAFAASDLRREEVIHFPTQPTEKKASFRNMILAIVGLLVILGVGYFAFMGGSGKEKAGSTAVGEKVVPQADQEAARKRMDELVASLATRYREGKIEAQKGPADEWSSPQLTFVFMDIKSDDDPKGANRDRLVNLLSQSLQPEPKIQIVERELLAKLLEELKLSASALADPATALRIGKLLSARIMVTGNIIPEGKGQVATLRFIDTETTAVKKVLSGRSDKKEVDSTLANDLGGKIVQWVKEEYPVRGKILTVAGDNVQVNLGKVHGLKKGDKLELVAEARKGSGMYVSLGEIEVKEVEKDKSTALVLAKKEAPKAGDKVRGR